MTTSVVLQAALAALPILLIMFLLLIARWSAARAAIAGLALALVLALYAFGLADRYEGVGALPATAGALAEALFTAGTILWILLPALAIHHLQERTGAIGVLQAAMARLSTDPRLLALFVAWFFALFFEGAAGFGTPVALTAPLLVALGLHPVTAVTLALLGHSIGVSFGAIGTPILPQAAATGLSGQELARVTGLLHGLLGWIIPVMIVAIITRAVPAEAGASRAIWRWTLLAAVLFLAPFAAIAFWVGPELPTLGGALLGGAVFVVALRLAPGYRTGTAARPRDPTSGGAGAIPRAAAPYLALTALILLTRLVSPIRHFLESVVWEWEAFGVFHGRFQPLYHPGTMLALAWLLGMLWQRASVADARAALAQTLTQLRPVAIALVAMLGLSRILVHAGMIDSLAIVAALGMGGVWPLAAPFVGVLGAFVTGSATASNILFTDFQQATAQRVGVPLLPVIGAQGLGAAVGNAISPHNIIAGSATVGLSGQEGAVLRRTLGPCLLYAGLGGLVALLLAHP